MGMVVNIEDHIDDVIEAKNNAVLRALEMIGIQAESHAANNLTASGHIDTGLLRNSITHAVSGEIPKNNDGSSSYEADTAVSKYRPNEQNAQKKRGEYSIAVPDADINERAVFVGSNVEYAPYIEYGTDKIGATHYIKNAVTDHLDEYKDIVKRSLQNA